MIGVGTDLVDVERLRQALVRTPGLRQRVFTPGEQAYADEAADPTQRLAARFAAKEATMKALGVGLGSIRLADIEVVHDDRTGAPALVLSGTAAALAAERGVSRWLVSLTHIDAAAHAVVIAL